MNAFIKNLTLGRVALGFVTLSRGNNQEHPGNSIMMFSFLRKIFCLQLIYLLITTFYKSTLF